ncbi:ABC transporter [Cellvibrio zantedeschiae]|uniref:ABC transporter n=1 Tax=Cellvibrio zantedeschiae TaxID=1237077 RepID=A0ABQ3B4A9_9GAMM|nr:ABC transporter ATP-binding protein [Cellvibrio zantedeschiae]GGY74600.1 ABC transporter [Cellvibrio zantedeschiae]
MNYLSASNLSLSLGNKTVVEHMTMHVEAGEFVGLIGPNGAGKSSLLRMLAALVKPKSGEVSLAPQNIPTLVEKIPAQVRARFMAYLAQHETPAWPLSVKNLVALGRSPWNSAVNSSAEDEAAIQHALTMTDIHTLAERPVTELSGGELQRALLARVFAGNPKLILADEPIAALDVYHQLHIMELLQSHAQQGGAVIAALHDLSLAARFCSRLILMHHGKLVAEGEPVKVLTPENLAKVYGVTAHVDCRDDGVVIIPTNRVAHL